MVRTVRPLRAASGSSTALRGQQQVDAHYRSPAHVSSQQRHDALLRIEHVVTGERGADCKGREG